MQCHILSSPPRPNTLDSGGLAVVFAGGCDSSAGVKRQGWVTLAFQMCSFKMMVNNPISPARAGGIK